MTVPALEKTWDHAVNNLVYLTSSNQELAARELQLAFHYILQDKVLGDYQGTFTDQGGGTFRYTLSAAQPVANRNWTEFRNGLFIPADVGRTINFQGATSGGNDGYFPITAVDPSGLWCEYTNGSGVAEAHAGSMRLLKGSFPNCPNGRSPWRVSYCATSTKGVGTAGDLIDRLVVESDITHTFTDGWVVWENEVTGTQFLMYFNSNDSAQQHVRNLLYFSVNGGFTGGALNVRPTAPTETLFLADTANTWSSSTVVYALTEWFLHLQISTDGKDTHFWGGREGILEWCFIDKEIVDPVDDTDGTYPMDGTLQVMLWAATSFDTPFSHGSWNDINRLCHAFDLGAVAGGPFLERAYLTAPFAVSSAMGQLYLLPDVPSGEYAFYPNSLFVNGSQVKGRIGRLADFWWVTDQSNMPVVNGATFPADGSKQWVKLNAMALPWDGTRYRQRDGD